MEAWTIGRMLSWMEGYLAEHGDADARTSTRWLVSDVVGMSFMQLYLNLDRPLDAEELARLKVFVRWRAAGEPVQYIVGKTAFRHIDVIVREGVLIPRPETEVLVSEALGRLPRDKHASGDAACDDPDLLIADLCTGSGCVACSIAYENPRARLVATDIDPGCVRLARDNAAALGLDARVQVVECDLGEGVDAALMGAFDAVVSNPPYVPTAVLAGLDREVRDFEPHLALDGGRDGLDVFRRIAQWSLAALKPGGFLAIELHETTLDAAAQAALSAGFADAEVARDLNGLPRILVARKPADDAASRAEGDGTAL